MMRHAPIVDAIIRTLEKALEEAARPETVARRASPDMMHRLLLARLQGALSVGNKKARRAAALIDQFDEAYEHATKLAKLFRVGGTY